MTLSPGTHEFSLAFGGHIRKALAHVPPGDAVLPRPVVVMLHGAGAEVRWALEETGWHRTADREDFLLLLPEALPLDPSHPASFLKNPTWWNDGSPPSRSAARDVDDVAFLTELLDQMGGRMRVDPRRVYVTGFSNGAAMTFRLAIERGERLAAIAPVAGYCWRVSFTLPRPVPSLYLIGEEDPLVLRTGGTVRSPWGWTEERPPVATTIERWRAALRGEAEFEVRFIPGLGHHWPGGRGLLSRRLFGPPSASVSASEVISDFFNRHALP
jgi:polyhydroxybutyrate depolymerase